jgi:hypothetical protein
MNKAYYLKKYDDYETFFYDDEVEIVRKMVKASETVDLPNFSYKTFLDDPNDKDFLLFNAQKYGKQYWLVDVFINDILMESYLYFNNCFYQAYHVEDGSIRWDDEKKVV